MTNDKKSLHKIAAIRLDRAGARAVGPYLAGVVYPVDGETLTNDEAHRLVSAKGFTELSAAEMKSANKGE